LAAKKISELDSTSAYDDNLLILVLEDGVTKTMSAEDLISKTLRVDKPSEINTVSAKSIVTDSDLLLIEDAADSNAKKKCTKAQFLNDVAQVLSGAADPASTPTKKGLIYIETTTPAVWISTGTASSADWLKVG
jgi:hypothetical protein